jgi:hypothetical protein
MKSAQPIDVITYTSEKGEVRPLRCRLDTGREAVRVFNVDRIIYKRREKLAGNEMILYQCESLKDNISFQIKYEVDTCKWILHKIQDKII